MKTIFIISLLAFPLFAQDGFWTPAMMSQQIATASSGPTNVINGLTLEWQLNGDLTDSSGSGFSGIAIGTPTYTTNKCGTATKSILLNGSSMSAKAASVNAAAATNDFSVGCWVYCTSLAGSPVALYKGNYNGEQYYTQFGTDGVISLICKTSAVVVNSTAAGAMTIDSWHFLVFVRSGTTTYIYVDSINKQTTANAVTGALTAPNSYYFTVGSYQMGNSYFFPGVIDDVRFYNRALSADEVTDLNALGPCAY